jgi:hypothetical protein
MDIDAQITGLVKEILAALLQGIIIYKLAAVKDIAKVNNSLNAFTFQMGKECFRVELCKEVIERNGIRPSTEVSVRY